MNDNKISVVELFAGVGGFHLGLKRANKKFDIIWANQYEPSRKKQFAFDIYKKNFPTTEISNQDIAELDKESIPKMDLLVGGFPCQDYSVASSGAKGLYGKKGVLWWHIRDIVRLKQPRFIFLENVDRLLSSPGIKTKNTGRDFGMILRTLEELGYCVSWKMINAADYGFPQKRRRTFIFASRKDTQFSKIFENVVKQSDLEISTFINEMKPFSNTLKNEDIGKLHKLNIKEHENLNEFSDNFNLKKGFLKTGFMIDGFVYMCDYKAKMRTKSTLKDILEKNVDSKLYLNEEKIEKFMKLKGKFSTTKISKTGFEYKYGMGQIPFPDNLNEPARTMVTSERTVSRMSHVVLDPNKNRLRFISPEEAEKINTFPVGWTKLETIIDSNRYFTMGNALVVDLIKEIGETIFSLIMEDTANNSIYYNKNHIEQISH